MARGAVYGLVGANGAGKTTLIKHILGLLRAESGSVRVFGLDPVADPVDVLSRIGYLSEENDLPGWMRIEELIRYQRAFYPRWDDAYAEELRRTCLGQSWVAPHPFPAVPLWTANWARRNRCGPKPFESVVAPDVTRREYTHCADDAAVVLYIVQGGGHAWPGGGPLPEWFVGSDSRSIDATSTMWAFFRAHPLRSK